MRGEISNSLPITPTFTVRMTTVTNRFYCNALISIERNVCSIRCRWTQQGIQAKRTVLSFVLVWVTTEFVACLVRCVHNLFDLSTTPTRSEWRKSGSTIRCSTKYNTHNCLQRTMFTIMIHENPQRVPLECDEHFACAHFSSAVQYILFSLWIVFYGFLWNFSLSMNAAYVNFNWKLKNSAKKMTMNISLWLKKLDLNANCQRNLVA